jgi:hypothetical protein
MAPPMVLSTLGSVAGAYASAGSLAAIQLSSFTSTLSLVGGAVGMMAGGQMQQAQQQAAVMNQNAAIARRDAIVQQQNAAYNAQVLEIEARQAEQIAAYNAQVLENEALAAEQRSKFQRDAARREAARLRGEQASLYGFSGVQLVGTPLVVEADSEFMAEANEANILSLGEMEAYNFRQKAKMQNYQAGIEAGRYRSGATETMRQGTIAGQALTAQAGVSDYQAGATRSAGYVGAGTTILAGAGQAATGGGQLNLFNLIGNR